MESINNFLNRDLHLHIIATIVSILLSLIGFSIFIALLKHNTLPDPGLNYRGRRYKKSNDPFAYYLLFNVFIFIALFLVLAPWFMFSTHSPFRS
jgi:hypothetical protein